MNDLETLRPEVREAWQRIVADEQHPEDFECVEAELLRLADECATLKAQSIYPRAQFLLNLADANERAEKAETELTIAHRERDRMFLDAREWATRFGEMEARAEKAQAEIVALKSQPFRGRTQDAIDRFAGGEELSHEEMCEVVNQAVCAERELAALKARIAEAPTAIVGRCALNSSPEYNIVTACSPLDGKRVRLVVEE